MSKINHVKLASKIVVGFSTSFVVANALRNNIIPDNSTQKVMLFIGSVVVGALVADHAENYVMKMIDENVAAWNEKAAKTN